MRRSGLVLLAGLLAGCAATSSSELGASLAAYDRSSARTMAQHVLLNIARVHRDLPPSFSTVANVVVRQVPRLGAGAGPAMTGAAGWLPVPTIEGALEQRPAFTITPLQGDEFTTRLLTPFSEQQAALLLGQSDNVAALLRLLGEALCPVPSGGRVLNNRPTDRDGYAVFRRVVAHLSSLQDRDLLRVAPLRFALHREVPAAAYGGADARAQRDDVTLRFDVARQVYAFDSQVVGRMVISNYDLSVLRDDERIGLQHEADLLRPNEILVDVRADHPGGEYPIHAAVRLRSWLGALTFVARGIAAEPEYDVAPDPRTPALRENPVRTLGVVEATRVPPGSALWVALGDRVYALAPERGSSWNRQAFAVLYQLFQLTAMTAPARTQPVAVRR